MSNADGQSVYLLICLFVCLFGKKIVLPTENSLYVVFLFQAAIHCSLSAFRWRGDYLWFPARVFPNKNPQWRVIIAFPNESRAVWTKNIWSTLSPPWCGRGLENSHQGPAVQERGLCLDFDTFHHVHGRFASSVKLCLMPCLLYKKCSQSCPRHTFLLVEQTGRKIRSLFKCRKHWASHLKMRSVVFANSRYVR